MADRQKFPNSGAIFANRAEGKRPTWSGNIELDGKLLKELIDSYKANGEAKLAVSGWDREGQRGPWISLRVERFGAWKEKSGNSRDYNRNRDDRGGRDDRDRDRDRGTTRSRYDDEDRRAAPRERERTREFDDDVPF